VNDAANLLIRVYGDSLSLPRASGGIRYFETYPELLRDAIASPRPDLRVAVYNRSKGGVPVTELYEQFVQDSAYFAPDGQGMLVVQCGVVDCAPRPVPPATRARIARLPMPMRWLIARFLHYARPFLLRAGIKWQATGIDAFQSVLTRWLRAAQSQFARVYVINIAPTVESIEAHSPGLRHSIESYNDAISAAVAAANSAAISLVDVYAAISKQPGGVSRYVNPADGHHITHLGHRLYADMIYTSEKERLDRSRAGC